MAEINTNYFNPVPQEIKTQPFANAYPYATSMPQEKTLKDEFMSQHKKNGLVERLYNGIKNLTGLGTGSKKVKQAIAKAESGEIDEASARNTIDKYRKSQANGEQAFGDLMSVGASGLTFFGLRKLIKKQGAWASLAEGAMAPISKEQHVIAKQCMKIMKSKPKFFLATAGVAALAGAYTKYWAMKFNRVGSDEFKIDKKKFNNLQTPTDKAMYKMEKKYIKSQRRNANFRNFLSGAINGLMMPISMLGGAIVGVPAYLMGNSLNRYFVGNHAEENKSVKGYVDNIKNDGITHAALAVATAIPMIKHARFAKVFDANLEKAVAHLKDKVLTDPQLQGNDTYVKIRDLLNRSEKVENIIYGPMDETSKAKALIEENIFAAKMKQTSNDGSPLTTLLKDNCPPSRTLDEAKQAIKDALGDGYEVKQLLGVGTVAETYLAKDSSGKEVCIKILKSGMDKEKVLRDKGKVIDIIKNSNMPQIEKDNLLRNVDDMANGLLEELNLQHEMDAANRLAQYTKRANVVRPIEVKNGVYVMEKANGISLSSLVELNSAYFMRDALMKNQGSFVEPKEGTKLYERLKGVTDDKKKLEIVNDYIKQVEARTPEFGDINLSKEDYKALIDEYQQVLVEQFNRVDKNGKVIHTDIHAGNIFIDVNALRNRKKGIVTDAKSYLGRSGSNKVFTLIDTGNVIAMEQDAAMKATQLTSYIKRGDVHDIAEYMLTGVEGAALGGHTKEDALKLLEKDLAKVFFDNETHLGMVTNESVVEMASNIMRKHGIVPADTQFTLNKAIHTANNSLKELYNAMGYFYLKDILDKGLSLSSFVNVMTAALKDAGLMQLKYNKKKSVQESLNLKNLSLEQIRKFKNNPNLLPTNDEKFLVYEMKQKIKPSKNDIELGIPELF